ncbi:MAG: sensor domain-containing diguanylate cyclase [Proteobacteria bacterium]|nr:sensor domain-containing diguanylate cyclase [Pseudomonadota bacterium]
MSEDQRSVVVKPLPSASLADRQDGRLERLLQVLFEIGKAIGSDHDLSVLLARISELVCSLVDADACSIMLLDMEGNRLLTAAAHGLRPERMHQISFRVGQGVAGWVVQHGEPALIDDVSTDSRYARLPGSRRALDRTTEAMICVPLVVGGWRIGVMTATSQAVGAFSRSDIDLLGFIAQTIALDIENVRLRRISVTDPLTGAYNREFLHQRLPAELVAAVQRGWPLSVAMVDVDHFKRVNDCFGHNVGDRVLAGVARQLRSAIRTDDMLVRYGGEEFLAVLPKADCHRAWEIGERMRVKLESQPLDAGNRLIGVRISVGIAQHRVSAGQSEEPSMLIRRADTALYLAKERGRNRVEVSP